MRSTASTRTAASARTSASTRSVASSRKKIISDGSISALSAYVTEAVGVVEAGDAGNQLSAWNIAGITDAFSTIIDFKRTLYWALTAVSTTYTVSLYKDAAGETLVSQGARSGNGEIDLLPQNESNIRGKVTVAYGAGDALDAANTLTQSDGIKLDWTHSVSTPTRITISRKVHGANNWEVRAEVATDAITWTDTTVNEDTKYDYKLSIENATGIYYKTIYTQMPKKILGFQYPFEDKDGVIYGYTNIGGYPIRFQKLVDDINTAVSTYTVSGYLAVNVFIDHNNRFFATGNGSNGYGNGHIWYTDNPASWASTKVLLNTSEPEGKFIPRGTEAFEVSGDTGNQLSLWHFYGNYDASNTNMDGTDGKTFKLFWGLTKSGSTVTLNIYNSTTFSAGTTVATGSIDADTGIITLAEANDSGFSGYVTVAYSGDDADASNIITLGKSSWYHSWGFDSGFDANGNRIWVIGNLVSSTYTPGTNDYSDNHIHYSLDGLNFTTIDPLDDDRHVHNVKYNPYNGWWYITDGDSNKSIYMTKTPQDVSSYQQIGKVGTGMNSKGGFTAITFTPNYTLLGTDDASANKVYRISNELNPNNGLSITSSDGWNIVLDFTSTANLTASRTWDMAAFEDGQVWLSTWHENTASTISSVWYSPDEGRTWQKMAEGAVKSTPDFSFISHGYNSLIRGDKLLVATHNAKYSYLYDKM